MSGADFLLPRPWDEQNRGIDDIKHWCRGHDVPYRGVRRSGVALMLGPKVVLVELHPRGGGWVLEAGMPDPFSNCHRATVHWFGTTGRASEFLTDLLALAGARLIPAVVP